MTHSMLMIGNSLNNKLVEYLFLTLKQECLEKIIIIILDFKDVLITWLQQDSKLNYGVR